MSTMFDTKKGKSFIVVKCDNYFPLISAEIEGRNVWRQLREGQIVDHILRVQLTSFNFNFLCLEGVIRRCESQLWMDSYMLAGFCEGSIYAFHFGIAE